MDESGPMPAAGLEQWSADRMAGVVAGMWFFSGLQEVMDYVEQGFFS